LKSPTLGAPSENFRSFDMIRICAAGAIVAAALPALAQDTYSFTINPKTSGLMSMFNAEAPVTGSFIGNYNPQSNPGGTRTLLGAFGFCTPGNQTVTFTGTGGATGSPATHPTGAFTLRIDTVADRAVLYALDLDLLGGTEPTVAASAEILYQAFRTCSPTGFFPSVNFPIDLGDAVITRLQATQLCAPSIGSIKEINPGEFTVSVPTTLVVDVGVIFNGEAQETTPIELPVTITGTVQLGNVMASGTLHLDVDLMQTVKGPIVAADDAPFDLPNPLGGTVHLLLDLTLTQFDVALTANGDLHAAGMVTATPCLADWNHDHAVNSQDFFDFLTSFFKGAADINCSGTTDSQDFFDFLSVFFGGC
jgi:hypothetical protein